jgi:hypothetical protein
MIIQLKYVPCRWTDGRRDRHDEAYRRLIKFCERGLQMGTILAGKMPMLRQKQAGGRQTDRQTDRYAMVTTCCLFAMLQESQEP